MSSFDPAFANDRLSCLTGPTSNHVSNCETVRQESLTCGRGNKFHSPGILQDAMPLLYRLAADGVVIFHAGYVLFVIVGQLLILLGILRKWGWIRNIWFRGLHLVAIAVVVAESLCGVTCPLTTLEKHLREEAGQVSYQGDFIADLVHDFLFMRGEPWMFTLAYSLFGLLVLATFVAVPPRWRGKKQT
jgi:polyferredoxin